MTQTLEQLSAAATELLPCPLVPIGWCKGGKITTYEGDSRFPAYARCESCRTTKMGATEAKAIAAWNTRTGQLVPVADDAIERYRQVKRGTVYEVVGEAELQMNADNLVDGSQMMVYRGEDGRLWCRHYDEFHDGRFAALAAKGTGDE